MNRKTLIMTFALLCGTIVCTFGAKPITLEVQQQTDEMQKRLFGQKYLIQVDHAASMTGGGSSVSCIVKIRYDKINSGLPYWGSGYNTFGDDAQHRFEGVISDYTVTRGKKNMINVTFTAKEPRGRSYKFKMDVFHNGTTFFNVTGTNLQPMRYRGVIVDEVEMDRDL